MAGNSYINNIFNCTNATQLWPIMDGASIMSRIDGYPQTSKTSHSQTVHGERSEPQWVRPLSPETGSSDRTFVTPNRPDEGHGTRRSGRGTDQSPRASASVEMDRMVREKDEVPKQKSIKGDLKYHEQEREGFQELRTLVQRWKKLPKAPTQERALKDAFDYIATVRVAVYKQHRLAEIKRKSRSETSMGAQREKGRRVKMRALFEDLSRYYWLEGKIKQEGDRRDERHELVWYRLSLLEEVLEDLKVRYPPPELSTISNSDS